MNPEKIKTAAPSRIGPAEKVFTAAEANSALVLVQKVVQDLVKKYKYLLTLRDKRHRLANSVGNTEQIETLNAEIERTTGALNELHTELIGIGCVLKDWSEGLVDFPAMHKGRRVWLCWRLGEQRVTHWHDLHGGYVGRQPIGPDFD
jgi:hypothetical protein